MKLHGKPLDDDGKIQFDKPKKSIDEAAERLRRIYQGVSYLDVYDLRGNSHHGTANRVAADYLIDEDKKSIADAYLTERPQLLAEVERLRKRVLSAAGDDLCRLSQDEIKDLTTGAVQIPPEEIFIASCRRFHTQIAADAGELQGCLTLAQMIAENEKLRAEIERLKSLLTDTAIGNLCADKDFSESIQQVAEMEAEAAAFRWLVEVSGDVFLDGSGNEYFIYEVDDGSISEEPIGKGATPLEAVEDARQRSEG